MQIAKRLPYYIALVYLVYLPFHVFLVQSLSLLTGGLDVWKVAKDIILAITVLFVICLVWIGRRATRTFNLLIGLAVLYAALHALLWMTHPDIYAQSAALGFTYNMRLLAFLGLGYGAVLLKPDLFDTQKIVRIIVIVGTVVAMLGVLQYFLPKDILTHAGYSVERGARAAFFIDDKADLPRVMSTLREPNALGGFLLVSIGLSAALYIRTRDHNKRILLAGMLGVQGLALFFTFSRSAWAAAIVVFGLLLGWYYRRALWTYAQKFWLVGIALLLLCGAGLHAARNNAFVSSYITHASNDEDLDSNDYHRIFLQRGLEGIADQPLGHGPGTAGLASIQNPKGSFLTENYYVQVAYEVGIPGLLVFIIINIVVYMQLWRRRNTVLGSVLLATFWAYVLMNMVLHTWANEAVAGQWWILAGLAIAGLKPEPER